MFPVCDTNRAILPVLWLTPSPVTFNQRNDTIMPNYGTTIITITGLEERRAVLHAALAATAYWKLAFSLVGAAPDIWISDGLLRDAEIQQKDDCLQLYVCMAYDGNCLPSAASLSRRDREWKNSGLNDRH